MKIYTKTGDAGETGFYGGQRAPKDHIRIVAYGEVDELNSVLGVARAEGLPAPIEAILLAAQHDLFCVGAELASPPPQKREMDLIGPDRFTALEDAIDQLEADLPPLRQFILPAGARTSAMLHLARSICRRAERSVVTLMHAETLREEPLIYLNRLGDLLFVCARAANAAAGMEDEPWQKPER
ncbi:cob(I)yrinic acid a,c-diamide adenosyltransferase [Lignipirellula cremea]|uniref:Corrinoid adenosyltransferase n=1 Tax=Lignipirellula cremea TaxID=2528010 RepID=A0A518E2U1_9BACT|nr:cob(I)yrinic acid a,c-diamide adenosyltransferase [Lignipirellula cremea]QDU98410.1 Cob(I)yrinic acid a,c-diamide adenosyltransferase [Lignipirellula cremea]